MGQILSPAITYARDGFPVSELIAYYWQRNVQRLKQYEGFAEVFMPDGKAPAKVRYFEILTLPTLTNLSPLKVAMSFTRVQ